MTRQAFYVHGLDGTEPEPVFEGPLAHQLLHVLRVVPGTKVELRNGCGQAWNAEIIRCGKRSVVLRLVGRRDADLESPLDLTLALAYARSERMDLVVRQGVELGIRRFIALAAERSPYRPAAERVGRKRERWLKIAQEAMCQCGRTVLPEMLAFPDLEGFLTALKSDRPTGFLPLLALESGTRRSLPEVAGGCPDPPAIVALVGCEGGWSPVEVERLLHAGFQAITLGPRILRLETAVTALVSGIQLLWGDLAAV